MLRIEKLDLLSDVEGTGRDDRSGYDLQRVVGVNSVTIDKQLEDHILVMSMRRSGTSGTIGETVIELVKCVTDSNGKPSRKRGAPIELCTLKGERDVVSATASSDNRLLVFTEQVTPPERSSGVSVGSITFKTVALLTSKSNGAEPPQETVLTPNDSPQGAFSAACYFIRTDQPSGANKFFTRRDDTWTILCVSDYGGATRYKLSVSGGVLKWKQEGDPTAARWHQWDPVARRFIAFITTEKQMGLESTFWLFENVDEGMTSDMKYRVDWHSPIAPTEDLILTAPIPYSCGNRSTNPEMNFAFLDFTRETGDIDYVVCRQHPAIVTDRDPTSCEPTRGEGCQTLDLTIDLLRSKESLHLCLDLRPLIGPTNRTDQNPLHRALLRDNAFGYRAHFHVMNGLLLVIVPNICVSYIDICHRNRPPRYLFTAAWPVEERLPFDAMSLLPLHAHQSGTGDFSCVLFHPTSRDRSGSGGGTGNRLDTYRLSIDRSKIWNWIQKELVDRGSMQRIRRAIHLVTMHPDDDSQKRLSCLADDDEKHLASLCRGVHYRRITSDFMVEYILGAAAISWRSKHQCQAVPFDGECLHKSDEKLLCEPKATEAQDIGVSRQSLATIASFNSSVFTESNDSFCEKNDRLGHDDPFPKVSNKHRHFDLKGSQNRH